MEPDLICCESPGLVLRFDLEPAALAAPSVCATVPRASCEASALPLPSGTFDFCLSFYLITFPPLTISVAALLATDCCILVFSLPLLL